MDAHLQIHTSSIQNKARKYRSRHRRTRQGQCAAACRALTAARLYLDGKVPNLTAAALCCGSCVAYVRAAVRLLASENTAMLEQARRGELPLPAAAEQMKRIAKLVHAYRTASAADRVAFAKIVGPTTLFDTALVPAL